MEEKKYCYIHKNVETRLKCTACGKSICPKCMVQSPVGYKCKECAQPKLTHLEEISQRQYLLGGLVGVISGIGCTYFWFLFKCSLGVLGYAAAYFIGFFVAKAITLITGHKKGLRIQVLSGMITAICVILNPLHYLYMIPTPEVFLPTCSNVAINFFMNPYSVCALFLAVLGSILEFKK